jgi:hypothetical protein
VFSYFVAAQPFAALCCVIRPALRFACRKNLSVSTYLLTTAPQPRVLRLRRRCMSNASENKLKNNIM